MQPKYQGTGFVNFDADALSDVLKMAIRDAHRAGRDKVHVSVDLLSAVRATLTQLASEGAEDFGMSTEQANAMLNHQRDELIRNVGLSAAEERKDVFAADSPPDGDQGEQPQDPPLAGTAEEV